MCGEALNRSACSYPTSKSQSILQRAFGLEIENDDPQIHPPRYCHRCRGVTYHTLKKGPLYRHRRQIFKWTKHAEKECEVCSHIKAQQHPKGGRKKKEVIAGRPKGDSNRALMTHAMCTAPAAWCPEGTPFAESTKMLHLNCAVCQNLLSRPLEISDCSSLVCCACLIKCLETAEDMQCPCCCRHSLKDFSTVRAPTSYFLKILGEVKVVCSTCKKNVAQSEYYSHNCNSQTSPEVSVNEIFAKSSEVPLTTVEEELQSHLVKRALTQSTTNSIKIKTGGQVKTNNIMHIPTCKIMHILQIRCSNIRYNIFSTAHNFSARVFSSGGQ